MPFSQCPKFSPFIFPLILFFSLPLHFKYLSFSFSLFHSLSLRSLCSLCFKFLSFLFFFPLFLSPSLHFNYLSFSFSPPLLFSLSLRPLCSLRFKKFLFLFSPPKYFSLSLRSQRSLRFKNLTFSFTSSLFHSSPLRPLRTLRFKKFLFLFSPPNYFSLPLCSLRSLCFKNFSFPFSPPLRSLPSEENGYTLVETIISLAILLLILVPLVSMVYKNNSVSETQKKITAICILEQEAAIIKTIPSDMIPVKRRVIKGNEWVIRTEKEQKGVVKYQMTVSDKDKEYGKIIFYGRKEK